MLTGVQLRLCDIHLAWRSKIGFVLTKIQQLAFSIPPILPRGHLRALRTHVDAWCVQSVRSGLGPATLQDLLGRLPLIWRAACTAAGVIDDIRARSHR